MQTPDKREAECNCGKLSFMYPSKMFEMTSNSCPKQRHHYEGCRATTYYYSQALILIYLFYQTLIIMKLKAIEKFSQKVKEFACQV